MEDLALYGITMKPEMQGLTEDQIKELKLGKQRCRDSQRIRSRNLN